MNYIIDEQVPVDIPGSGPRAHMHAGSENDLTVRISVLAERAVMLGDQLCFVCWDQQVYSSIVVCVDELGEAAATTGNMPLAKQARYAGSLLSVIAQGHESGDVDPFSALTSCLQQIRILTGNIQQDNRGEGEARGSGNCMRECNRKIALLGNQSALGECMRWMQSAGFEVLYTGDAAELTELLEQQAPVALVIDLSSYEDEPAMLEHIAPHLDAAPAVNRLIFLSRRADQDIRMRSVQAGGDAFLTKPVAPQLLLQQLELAVFAGRHSYTVLLVGASDNLTSRIAPILEKAGMTVKCQSNTSQALMSVINATPDLLVLDHYLEDGSGGDLGRVIHQLADYEDLPVVHAGNNPDQQYSFRPDYLSEWMDPETIDEESLLAMIDRLVYTSKFRINRINRALTSDAVTGLMNQQGFYSLLEQNVSEDRCTALINIEFDKLQQHYPQLPPQMVNRFIALISRRLERLLVSQGQLAHVGDYTFACLVSCKSPDEIRKLGQFLCHSLSTNTFDVEQHSINLICSIGIAITDGTHPDGYSLMMRAMQACNEARIAGRNRVCLRSMESSIQGATAEPGKEKGMLEIVQDALVEDRFRLVYQPIASLRGSAVEKYEVLLRLTSDQGETIMPGVFLPVAEEHGLMKEIDRWVVGHAIESLQRQSINSCFFVKISTASLRDAGYVEYLKEILARYGAVGERLVFEISSSSASDDPRHVAEFTQQVGMLGCGVSVEIDDIRNDLTLLLEHVQASYVKLNRSAIESITHTPDSQIYLKNIVDLAEQKAAMTIAGFIEDPGCLQQLWQSGVHYIQGNYLQEPNEVLDFEFGVEATVQQEGFPA